MPTKPGYTTTEFWAATVTALVGFLNQAFGWNIPPETFASVAAVIAGYAISRGLAKKQPPVVAATPVPSTTLAAARMTAPLIAIAALSLGAFGLTSCSNLGSFFGGTVTTDEVTSLTAVAVSNALAFGIKDSAQRATVAKEMVSISDIYVTYSNGSVPTPEQFQALLNKYIPAGDSKAITVSDITALYTLRYSSFKDYKLPDQVAYLTAFLNGVKNGAAPFATPVTFGWVWPWTPVHPKLPDAPVPPKVTLSDNHPGSLAERIVLRISNRCAQTL
jgi:hypothetical protein